MEKEINADFLPGESYFARIYRLAEELRDDGVPKRVVDDFIKTALVASLDVGEMNRIIRYYMQTAKESKQLKDVLA